MDHVLACVDGLRWRDLAPFVLSVRAHAPAARLVIFATRLDPDTRRAMRRAGAELHCFDALFPLGSRRTELVRTVLWRGLSLLARTLRYPGFKRRLLLRAGGLLLPRNQARFFAYLAFLEDCTLPGDRLLLCDARDLVFQADPFPRLGDGLVLTAEEADVPIVQNAYNARWYKETYGAALLARHGHHPVVCAGLLGGERDAVLDFLERFVAESCRRPRLYGADQAILNHLHITGSITAAPSPNRGGLAWHLFGVPPAQVRIRPDHTITDTTGHLYPIIHMYDRHDHTLGAVRKLWANDETT
ncbi:MAG: hypothetical protein H7067_20285 [Burkholderiales bacterium]|nr:hypothetical protein [Opitutaceae bacterium]